MKVALFSGIGMALLLAAALLPNWNECRILSSSEVTEIRGGASSSGGGGKGVITPVPANAPKLLTVPITLDNIPYISQYTDSTDRSGRSDKYCGIASALMVRAKGWKGTYSFPISSSSATYPMQTMDKDLRDGNYGGHRIDVIQNRGLLYLSQLDGSAQQYSKTITVLKSLYKPDAYTRTVYDTYRVSDIAPKVLNRGDATVMLWNHIKNNKEPAVVIIDSNKTFYVQMKKPVPNMEPVLHYIVIAGIFQSGSAKYFWVRDPAMGNQLFEYTESQLQTLMTIPDKTDSAWLYYYAIGMGIFNPCYILLVQGA
jgi:hypothetical protein